MRYESPYGPRSVTVHWTLAPVERLVTVTTVPFGRVRCAHSPGCQSYQDAPPDSVFGGAVVVVVVVFGGAVASFAGFTVVVVDDDGGSTDVVVGAAVVVVTSRSAPNGSIVAGALDDVARGASTLTDAALASVLGMLSITRIGSASTVSQTAKTRRRRGTTYGCRTSPSLASRAPSFPSGGLVGTVRVAGTLRGP